MFRQLRVLATPSLAMTIMALSLVTIVNQNLQITAKVGDTIELLATEFATEFDTFRDRIAISFNEGRTAQYDFHAGNWMKTLGLQDTKTFTYIDILKKKKCAIKFESGNNEIKIQIYSEITRANAKKIKKIVNDMEQISQSKLLTVEGTGKLTIMDKENKTLYTVLAKENKWEEGTMSRELLDVYEKTTDFARIFSSSKELNRLGGPISLLDSSSISSNCFSSNCFSSPKFW